MRQLPCASITDREVKFSDAMSSRQLNCRSRSALISDASTGSRSDSDGSVEAAVRQFGQQTVWCAVALLRRVLRGAHWPTSAPAADEVEARLASLAVSMMRQAVAAVGTADRDAVDA